MRTQDTQDMRDMQEELHRALDARVRAAGPRGPGAAAVAVLRSFDARGFAQSVIDFAAQLPEDARREWLADFTRTVFLAGNPANLAVRLPPSVVGRDGQVAWYAPTSGSRHRELRLLLRLVQGELPHAEPFSLDVPGAGPEAAGRWRLAVATAGLSLPQYLVHVNHTLAEAVLTGILRPGDRLTVEHVRRLDALPARYAYLRVHRDTEAPDRLRAYACLTEATGG
jgi:uncharacterized protein DUF6182